MLCLVRYLIVISTSVIDCLGRFVSEMTYYVSSGTLNLTQLNSTFHTLHPTSADDLSALSRQLYGILCLVMYNLVYCNQLSSQD